MNGVSGRPYGDSNAGTTRHSGSDAYTGQHDSSLGVATDPVDGQNYHGLLQAADVTMYRNKASCRTVSSHVPEAA